MLIDSEARVALKELIEKYLKGAPHYDRLTKIFQNLPRKTLIRGLFKEIRRHNNIQHSQQDLELIDDLL